MIVLCGYGIDIFLQQLGLFKSFSENDWRCKCCDCRSICGGNETKTTEFAIENSKDGYFSFVFKPSDEMLEAISKSDVPSDEIKVVHAKGEMIGIMSDMLAITVPTIRRIDKKLMLDAKRLGWNVVDIDDDDYSMHDLYRDLRGKCGLHCCGCGKGVFDNTNYFMLHDELWRKICKKGKRNETDVLCKRCCELILGRKLTRKDLNDAPINLYLKNWK